MGQYSDLREFIQLLEHAGDLRRIRTTVNPRLEMTEIAQRVLHRSGPALIFEQPTGHRIPVLANLFGRVDRVAWGMGQTSVQGLREIGELLAFLRQPEPPGGMREAWEQLPLFRKVLDMAPKKARSPACRQHRREGREVDLGELPVQTCWPEDAGPLLTWGLTITRQPGGKRQNIGIYRQQVIDRNRIIMRWLAHRGGAIDYQRWRERYPDEPFPVAVALGADPATLLAAVTPIPDSLSEYAFAGLLRGSRSVVGESSVGELTVPGSAEFILEGHIYPNDTAPEGPFGDHTGYYNEVEEFPVFTVERVTHRDDPIYHSTYTGRPPDEPAILGMAMNDVFVPLFRKQFPEVLDFYLPPEACSYRLAVVSIEKQYPGHARRLMFGVWSFLRQFMYTKYVIIVDGDVDARNWHDVIWALVTRVDPDRDMVIARDTPIDYLDFASPIPGLGSKMGLDATNKWPGETQREWGRPLRMTQAVQERVDALWSDLGLDDL